jgi:hypothetical protein
MIGMPRLLRTQGIPLALRGACFICGMVCVAWGFIAACVQAGSQEQGKRQADKPRLANEIVMVPGMEISATNELGKITIVAGPDLQRTYRWESCEGSLEMVPRRKRWYGSLGIYYPGPGDHWKECGGITRAVVEECWWHHDSVEAALKEIRNADEGYNSYNGNKKSIRYYVYTDDGLVVMWSKTPERKQLNVEVRQILIDGRKPTRMPGSHNENFAIRYRKLDGVEGEKERDDGKG